MAWKYELEQELAEFKPLLPYLEMAKQLKSNIDARIASDGMDPETAVAIVCAEQEEETIRSGLEQLLERMPLEAVLEQYAARLGVTGINEVLARVGSVRVLEAERQAKLDRIRYESKVSQTIDLRRIDAGEIVQFGLFRDDMPDKRYEGRARNGRIIIARMRDQGEAIFQTITDKWGPNYSSVAEDNVVMPSNTSFRIGTLVDEDLPLFEPVLTAGTTPNLRAEGRAPRTLALRVGYVCVGDMVLLDSPAPLA